MSLNEDMVVLSTVRGLLQQILDAIHESSTTSITHHTALTKFYQRIEQAYTEFCNESEQATQLFAINPLEPHSRSSASCEPTSQSQRDDRASVLDVQNGGDDNNSGDSGARHGTTPDLQQPTSAKKRARSGTALKPAKRGRRMMNTEAILFAKPPETTLLAAELLALNDSNSSSVTPQQWSYLHWYGVLPITFTQWADLPTLLDQVQHILDQDGAILVHPAIQSSLSPIVDPSALDISFSVIRSEVRQHSSHICFATGSQRVNRTVNFVDKIDGVLQLADFETGLAQPGWESLYANDIDVSQLDGETIVKSLGIEPQLRQLKGSELPSQADHLFPGVNDVYFYLGEKGSSFYLHLEDEQLYSVNMVHTGQKNWQIFRSSDKGVIENYFRQGKAPRCDQFVRHEDAYLPSNLIRSLGLQPKLIEQLPGQVVITSSNAYHQGYNALPCISEAVNYGRHWRPVDYSYCDVQRCSTSQPTLYTFRYRNSAIQINEHESVPVNALHAVRMRIDGEQQAEGASQTYLYHKIVSLVLRIGDDAQLDALRREMEDLSIFQPSSFRSAYNLLDRSRTSVYRSETARRLAMLYLHKHITSMMQVKRAARERRKGFKQPEVPRESVVQIAVESLGLESHDAAHLQKELNSYTFKNIATAYEKLVGIYGHVILALLPRMGVSTSTNAADIQFENIFKADKRYRLSDFFCSVLNKLRPDFRRLCTDGPYKDIWDNMYPDIESLGKPEILVTART